MERHSLNCFSMVHIAPELGRRMKAVSGEICFQLGFGLGRAQGRKYPADRQS